MTHALTLKSRVEPQHNNVVYERTRRSTNETNRCRADILVEKRGLTMSRPQTRIMLATCEEGASASRIRTPAFLCSSKHTTHTGRCARLTRSRLTPVQPLETVDGGREERAYHLGLQSAAGDCGRRLWEVRLATRSSIYCYVLWMTRILKRAPVRANVSKWRSSILLTE